jgi:hypothetical protein
VGIVAAIVLVAGTVMPLQAASVYTWELADTYNDLSATVSDSDLINGFGVNTDGNIICDGGKGQGINESAIAPGTFGIVDADNGIFSWLMNSAAPGCLQMIELLPSDGFYVGLPPPAENGNMPDLVDGQLGDTFKTILRDYARAALVVRYGFACGATDVGSIRVIGGNDGRDGRVFHHYDVWASTDGLGHQGSFFPVALGVRTGNFVTGNPGTWQASLTNLFNFDSDTLIAGCTDLRIVFYCVDNTQRFFIDPWQGNASEVDPYPTNCPDVEDQDTDGYRKAYVAPIIKEIDVFPPGPTPWGDIDYDEDRDTFDFAAFQLCAGQDVSTNGCYRFDYDDNLVIDLDDYNAWEATFQGPDVR